ncbi:hypothetical protein GQ607_003025 [Colletotrichum asianum]|uniref:Uncharacterized protein n=1 Tax=Colletotrichum asianum TaxID=702518 RepID=A0A8H3WSG3_9PEZI|nr:hypothetical protein GQ607_003025 [Colletotrichum asianum]
MREVCTFFSLVEGLGLAPGTGTLGAGRREAARHTWLGLGFRLFLAREGAQK